MQLPPFNIHCGDSIHLRYQPERKPSINLPLRGLRKNAPKAMINDSLSLSHLYILSPLVEIGLFRGISWFNVRICNPLCLYVFSRGGEFTTCSAVFNPSLDLTLGDVANTLTISPFILSIPNLIGRGVDVPIAKTDILFCPLRSMSNYLSSRPRASRIEPLFITDEGGPLTRAWFVTKLRLLCRFCGLPPESYYAHSLPGVHA